MFYIVKQPLTYVINMPQEQIIEYTKQYLNKEEVTEKEVKAYEINVANEYDLIDMNVGKYVNLGKAPQDVFNSDEAKKVFAILSKKYIGDKSNLTNEIDKFLNGDCQFEDIFDKILQIDNSLSDSDKNKIWNYALLDGSTNKEYGNVIFPIKRAFVANKERGYKIKYKMSTDGKIDTS